VRQKRQSLKVSQCTESSRTGYMGQLQRSVARLSRRAGARSRGSLLRSRQEYNKIVPVDSAKQGAGLFVEKIAIDPTAGQ
jgi:hypothetical protein